jgi:spoIIIJ-associated protein
MEKANNIAVEIKTLLEELFKLIGIEVKIEVSEDKSGDEVIYQVELDAADSAGLLIGSHGMTLSSIQSFLTIALKQKTGEWVKIVLDIAHWAEKQNERLNELAQQTAERAKQTGEEQKLYNLSASSRRIVHMALRDSDVVTESVGEGQDRYLVVRPK